jgi:hypothetical protein
MRLACLCLVAAALVVSPLASCNGSSSAADAGAPVDATTPLTDGEPQICTEFTEVGDPCSKASAVRCFPECEAGGCSCSPTGSGPRWTCTTDLSCVPDCAPIDDGCTPAQGGDGSAIADSGDASEAGDAAPADGGGGDAGDASDASDAADSGIDAAGASDAASG